MNIRVLRNQKLYEWVKRLLYLKYRINANEIIFYNKYDFDTPEIKMHNNLTIVKELSN